MKGFLLLSTTRSGSTWLCKLSNGIGTLGNAGEWLHPGNAPSRRIPPEEHFRRTIERATSRNKCFAVKIFPAHLTFTRENYRYDFVAECLRCHDVSVSLLLRRDQLRQAISLARALQTNAWTSTAPQVGVDRYDYELIYVSLLRISQDNAFWQSYAAAQGLEPEVFYYEDLLPDPHIYLSFMADRLDVPANLPERVSGTTAIQRDEITEAWATRFVDETRRGALLPSDRRVRQPPPTLANLVRLMSRRPLSQAYKRRHRLRKDLLPLWGGKRGW